MYQQKDDGVESNEATRLLLVDAAPSVKGEFVRKVYGLVTAQLLLTFGWMLFASLHLGMRTFVLTTPLLQWTSAVVAMVLVCPMVAYRERHPYNLLLLMGFTLCEAYFLGVVGAEYASKQQDVLLLCSVGWTLAIFAALSGYVHVTKRDMTFLEGGLTVGTLVLVGMALFLALMPQFALGRVLLSGCGVVIFCGYILYDTSTMLHYMTPDDAIMAAVQLYLDIVNLFMCLLQLLDDRD